MNRLKQILFTLLALPALVSCDNDTLPVIDGQEQPVTLSVSLDKGAMSRASVTPGDLDADNFFIDGEYSIFLGLSAEGLALPKVHCCSFTSDKKGLIYPVTNGTPAASPLKWSDAEIDKKDFKFIIDNLGYTETCIWNPETEFLGKTWDETEKALYAAQEEQYSADKTPIHTNDIIWGKDTAKYDISGKSSVVELTHRMTRLNVVFVNLDNTLTTQAERESMTVSIDNLVLTPESFNRYDGKVSIGENPAWEKLTLKDTNKDLIELGEQTEGDNKYKEYATPNFILPPQPLDEAHWPKVVVTYRKSGETDKRTVSGLIPHEILYENNGNDNSSWVKLDKLSAAHHLTIVVEIKEGIPDIIFTAKVKEWVGIGPMTVTAAQRKPGINNKKELEETIRMYNSLPVFASTTDLTPLPLYPPKPPAYYPNKIDVINDRMMLYGTPDIVDYALQWTFTINFKIKDEDMPKTGFRNIMWATANNNRAYSYPLVLTSAENTDDVLNKLKGEPGIYNIEDLNAMISTFIIPNYYESSNLFGNLDINWTAKTATYTFTLMDNITGNVERKLPKELNGFTMTYVMNSNGFKVNGSTDVNTLIE